jgi:APA family basic amino acid/polyamine antiporter
LGSKIEKEGGEYYFVYAAFGKKIGFLAGLLWIFATAISGVIVSIAFASYLVALIPFIPVKIIAMLAIIAFMLIDTLGIRISSKTNHILVLIKIGVLLLFILIGISFVNFSNFNNFFVKGATGVLSSTFLIFFAYAGFGKLTSVAEEVKQPKKTIPKAIIVSILISSLLYILSSFVSIGVVGWEKLSSVQYSLAPFAYVMLSTGFPYGFLIIALGALAATANVLLIQMLGISRTVYAMSANNQLPSFLSKVHPRFKTPYIAGILIGALMALGALILNTNTVIALTAFGIISYYAFINLAALKLRKRKGEFNIHHIIPIVGFVLCVLLIAFFLLAILFNIPEVALIK